jgi:lipopolysaccharide transport system ATP-binding protein
MSSSRNRSDLLVEERASFAVVADDISKIYRKSQSPSANLAAVFRNVFGSAKSTASPDEQFHALRGISFKIGHGEAVGIIGRNGSGKSTLLQIIAGTMPPTSGTVDLNGRVGALLELGSGFNPEFTGRENVALYASILGFTTDEAKERLPGIIEFAEIGAFLDQPIKTYSTGMVVRLAFSVQTAFLPDILIVDEALSVGDVFFQRKCFSRIEEFISKGGTLFFVTHDTGLVQRLCNRCILLESGMIAADGSPRDVVKEYYRLHQGSPVSSSLPIRPERNTSFASAGLVSLIRSLVTGDGGAYIHYASFSDDAGRARSSFDSGEWACFSLGIEFLRAYDEVHIGIGFRDRTGVLQGGWHNYYTGEKFGPVKCGESFELNVRVKIELPPGDYLVLLGIAQNFSASEWKDIYSLWDCARLTVTGRPAFWGKAKLSSELATTDRLWRG